MCTRRGEIQPAQGEFRGSIKTANTPPSLLRVRRFNGMNRTPRVVIPPPTQKCRKSAVCRREQRVRRRRAPTLRKPFFCRNKPRTGLFRHSHSGRRVMIPPPHGNAENAKRESYHLPQQGSRRNPAKRFRWEEDERQRERVLPLAAGRGIRRPLGRRPASHLSGLRRSRCPAKRSGRAKPCTQIPGGSPAPTFSYDWRKT